MNEVMPNVSFAEPPRRVARDAVARHTRPPPVCSWASWADSTAKVRCGQVHHIHHTNTTPNPAPHNDPPTLPLRLLSPCRRAVGPDVPHGHRLVQQVAARPPRRNGLVAGERKAVATAAGHPHLHPGDACDGVRCLDRLRRLEVVAVLEGRHKAHVRVRVGVHRREDAHAVVLHVVCGHHWL